MNGLHYFRGSAAPAGANNRFYSTTPITPRISNDGYLSDGERGGSSQISRSYPGSVVVTPGPGYPGSFLPEVIKYHSQNIRNEEASRAIKERLPAADHRQSLVANPKYTAYKAQEGGKFTLVSSGSEKLNRSLPTSRTQDVSDSRSRQANSAPHNKAARAQAAAPPSLPKINTLVTGKQTQLSTQERSRNVQKFSHAGKSRKIAKELTEEGAAGLSTRDHDVQTITSTKFASSWANARVDHLRTDTSKERQETAASSKVDLDESKRSNKSTKDYDKPWLTGIKRIPSKSPVRDSKPKESPTKKVDSSLVDSPKESPKDKKVTIQVQETTDKAQSSPADGRAEKKPLTRRATLPARLSFAPPRRERTRMRIQRAKSQAILDPKQLIAADSDDPTKGAAAAASTEGPDTTRSKPRRYSNTDAANVYYVNAAAAVLPAPPVRRRSKLTTKDPSAGPSDNEGDTTLPLDSTQEANEKPREYILSRRESLMYVSIRSVYDVGTEKHRQHREKRFYKNVEQLQKQKWRQEQEDYRRRQLRAQESKERQALQLKRVRERFDEEQVRRFRNQYVTGKVLEHEWQTRHIYGLPDTLDSQPKTTAKLRPRAKRPARVFDTHDKQQRNRRRYKKLFSIHRGPRWDPRAKTPKMEGIDTIVVGGESDEEGKPQGRKMEVKDIVGDALQVLEEDDESISDSPRKTKPSNKAGKAGKPQTSVVINAGTKKGGSNKTGETTKHAGDTKGTADFLSRKPTDQELEDRPSLDLSDDDLSEEDIFEKARRKYNIVLDSDDDL